METLLLHLGQINLEFGKLIELKSINFFFLNNFVLVS